MAGISYRLHLKLHLYLSTNAESLYLPHSYFLRRAGLGGVLRLVTSGLDGAVVRLVVFVRVLGLLALGMSAMDSFLSVVSICSIIISQLLIDDSLR